jgi:FAD:protein FMN transferase
MTIPYCVKIGETLSKKKSDAVETLIINTFLEINEIYNYWNPESEISKLNRHDAYEKIPISNQLATFLLETDRIVHLTEGRFDPTVASIQQLWKNSLEKNTKPSHEILTATLDAVGWHNIHVQDTFFWKDHSETILDLSGIAKGLAVDLLIDRLFEMGFVSLYVEWGGEIRTHGHHPEGRPWRVAIMGLCTIDMNNQAIATSGIYIQNWNLDGDTYSHIIDPQTHEPIKNSPITSATVLAPTCAEADAFATALMLFPSIEQAKAWAHEMNLSTYVW